MKKYSGICWSGRLAPLFFAVFFFSHAGHALAADRLQERMEVMTGAKAPISVQADKVDYDRKAGTFTLTGKVTISQGDMTLTADRATLNEGTGAAEASGRARVVDGENVLFAERIEVNFQTKLGSIEDGSIFVKKENFHITGRSLRRVREDQYEAVSGGLTTCDGDRPAWSVTAGELRVRMDRDVTARDVVFRVRDIPVLYSPFAWFPLVKPRTTGFLVPGMGYSSSEGMRVYNSFYWAPVDNFDATLSADYRSKRGVGMSGDLRWAPGKDTLSKFYGYFLDDRKDKRERYNLIFSHRQALWDRGAAKADLNFSDRHFYKELTNTARERTQRSLDSNATVTDLRDWGMSHLFAQYTESLDADNGFTVQRLPELGLDVMKKRLFGTPMYLDLQGAGAYFLKDKGVAGCRFDLYPKLSGVFNLGGVNVSPRVGYRETVYDLAHSGKDAFDDERGLFGTGVTAQTGFSRLYRFDSGPLTGLKHTAEPVVAYNYVYRRGGMDFVKFDGVDTFDKRSIASYSIVNRFVMKYRDGKDEPRVDYLTLKLSQFYDLYRDTLVLGRKRSLSDLYGEVVYKSGEMFSVNNSFRYNYNGGRFLSVNTDVRFMDRLGRWRLVLGQRFSDDTGQPYISPSRFDFFTPSADFVSEFTKVAAEEDQRLNFITAEAGAKLGGKWEVSGKVWYDVHNENVRETDASLGYSSQCWGVTASFVKRPGEHQVMVTINLKGLGNVKI